MWVHRLDWADPEQRQMADTCDCGNEPSGSVKCGEFLDQLQTSQLLKKDSAPWSKEVSVLYADVCLDLCDSKRLSCKYVIDVCII